MENFSGNNTCLKTTYKYEKLQQQQENLYTHRKCILKEMLKGVFKGRTINVVKIHRGYCTMAWRYEFYFQVAKKYFTSERSEWVKYCFCHKKIKFISSSHHVTFFLLFRQKDIDKIMEGNDQNYVMDKLKCEIMENKPLGSWMLFLWILRVVYFPVKHSCLYNK